MYLTVQDQIIQFYNISTVPKNKRTYDAGCALPRSLQLSYFVHTTGKVQGSQSIKEVMLHYFLNNKN